jgi:gamma-glutamylputrescine oxidase
MTCLLMQGDEVLKLVELRFQGLQLLRKRVGDMQLQYKERGSFELISKDESDALDKIDAVNKFLAPVLKIPAYSLADDRLDSFGFQEV